MESPYGFVVKRTCSCLHQLQYCKVSCVLDYKPLLHEGRWHYYCTSKYIIINLFNYVLQWYCIVFVWCLCMAINVSVQHNGGFLPHMILLTQCCYHRGTLLNVIKRLCICSLLSHLNVLTFSPLTRGCSEGLDALRFFFIIHNENHFCFAHQICFS